MISLQALPHLYEDLANHFAKQGESRQRDQCLALAADAALTAGMPQEAERLRKRLLLTNPNHLLRPYASMADAMRSDDVRDYVTDLRRQWPPDMVEKLLNQSTGQKPTEAATATQPTSKARMKTPKGNAMPADEPVTAASYALAVLVFIAGVVLASGLLLVAFAWPLLE